MLKSPPGRGMRQQLPHMRRVFRGRCEMQDTRYMRIMIMYTRNAEAAWHCGRGGSCVQEALGVSTTRHTPKIREVGGKSGRI